MGLTCVAGFRRVFQTNLMTMLVYPLAVRSLSGIFTVKVLFLAGGAFILRILRLRAFLRFLACAAASFSLSLLEINFSAMGKVLSRWIVKIREKRCALVETRTRNQFLKRELLYQLSYKGIMVWGKIELWGLFILATTNCVPASTIPSYGGHNEVDY